MVAVRSGALRHDIGIADVIETARTRLARVIKQLVANRYASPAHQLEPIADAPACPSG